MIWEELYIRGPVDCFGTLGLKMIHSSKETYIHTRDSSSSDDRNGGSECLRSAIFLTYTQTNKLNKHLFCDICDIDIEERYLWKPHLESFLRHTLIDPACDSINLA